MKIFKKSGKYLLYPLALLYGGVVFSRNLFYTLNFFMVHKINGKVVSIGNSTSGGTGKTPMVISWAVLLKSLDKKVAVLSRGNGRGTKGR
jgi:Tetraacyldisaccharide-1-P 4''-kinase